MSERRLPSLVEWCIAAVAGAVFLLASDLLVPPAAVPFAGHGERFVAIAQDPFAFTGEFPQRILWPLLAWLAAKVGIGPVAFSQVCNGVLLAVVFWFCRQRRATFGDAALVTAAVAASGAVLVYKPITCMSDTLVLALLLLAVHHVRRAVVFWALVLLGALAHEMVLFFAPWLVWLRHREGGGSLRGAGVGLVVVVAAYAAWRFAVGGATYGFWYYIQNSFWVPWLLPGLWALWLLVLLAEFGPLLAVVVAGLARGEHGLGGRTGAWLFLGCVLLLMVLAYDVMRFATFAVVPLVVSSAALVRSVRGRVVLGVLIAAQIVVYAWAHPVPSQQGGAVFTRVGPEMLALAAPHIPEGERVPFGPALAVLRDAFAREAGTWLAVVGVTVAIVAAGLWLARWLDRPRANDAAG